MALMIRGLSNTQIAKQLGFSKPTFDQDLLNALDKLHAKSRSHAVYLLFQQGVLR